jgi:hypothetical protein
MGQIFLLYSKKAAICRLYDKPIKKWVVWIGYGTTPE